MNHERKPSFKRPVAFLAAILLGTVSGQIATNSGVNIEEVTKFVSHTTQNFEMAFQSPVIIRGGMGSLGSSNYYDINPTENKSITVIGKDLSVPGYKLIPFEPNKTVDIVTFTQEG